MTTAELVEAVGGEPFRIVTAPAGVDTPITRVVLLDPNDPARFRVGDLVVGIGIVAGSSAERLFSHLVAGGAAGLIIKEPTAGMLAAEAQRLGLTLLAVPASAQWVQVVLLVSSLISRENLGTSADLGTEASDLYAIADIVAELVDGPITIEDPHCRVIAFSKGQEEADEVRRQTILGRQVPYECQQALRSRGVFRRLARESGPIYIEDVIEGMSPRVAIALKAGDELLGSIWAAVSCPLSASREASLVEASHFIALHLLRKKLDDHGSRHDCEFLDTLFNGGEPALQAAEDMGLTGPSFVALIAVPTGDKGAVDRLLPRLRDLVAMHLSSDQVVPAAIIGTSVCSVISIPASTRQVGGSLRGRMTRLLERSESVLRTGVMIGIGSVVHSVSAVADSRDQAEQVIRVLRAEGRTGVVDVATVASKVLLLRLSDSMGDDRDLLLEPIRILQRHDEDSSIGFLPTLAAYLRAFGSIEETAQELRVHTNTVRYRLRQIQNLTGLQLTDPDERLAMTIQLRLLAQRGLTEPAKRRPAELVQLPKGASSSWMKESRAAGRPARSFSTASITGK